MKRVGRSTQGEGESPCPLGWALGGLGDSEGLQGWLHPDLDAWGRSLGKVRGHSSACTESRVSHLSQHISGSAPTPQG